MIRSSFVVLFLPCIKREDLLCFAANISCIDDTIDHRIPVGIQHSILYDLDPYDLFRFIGTVKADRPHTAVKIQDHRLFSVLLQSLRHCQKIPGIRLCRKTAVLPHLIIEPLRLNWIDLIKAGRRYLESQIPDLIPYHVFPGCYRVLPLEVAEHDTFQRISRFINGIIQHLCQLLHVRDPLPIDSQDHHDLSCTETRLNDQLLHQTFFPFRIPACNIVFDHELAQCCRSSHSRPRLQITLRSIYDFMTSRPIKTHCRLAQIFYDPALAGDDPAGAHRKTRLVAVTETSQPIVILRLHADDRCQRRLFDLRQTPKLFPDLLFLNFQLKTVLHREEGTPATAFCHAAARLYIRSIFRRFQDLFKL